MYEKLIWTHLFGIHARNQHFIGSTVIGEFPYHNLGSRLTTAVRKLAK
jgi:hypothetical protein